MKIVIAPDSFKGSLTAVEAAEAMATGVRRTFPDAQIVCIPMADGGEGTVDAWLRVRPGHREVRTVTGPLGEPVEAAFGVLDDEYSTAVIESAAASGLMLVPTVRRNPLLTTTYGTGELIRHAIDAGCRRLIIGLGGTATNDCGAGALQALGLEFEDDGGKLLTEPISGGTLANIASALRPSTSVWGQRGSGTVILASDVMNPLTGPDGASAVYGPQKGATPEMVSVLDAALAHFAAILKLDLGPDVVDVPGAGAAGGLGGALMAYFGAKAQSGIDLILDAAGFDNAIRDADVVITGEGSIDRQTLSGKAVAGVLRRCRAAGATAVAIGGIVEPGVVEELKTAGLAAVEAAAPIGMSRDEAMRRAAELVAAAAARVSRAQRPA